MPAKKIKNRWKQSGIHFQSAYVLEIVQEDLTKMFYFSIYIIGNKFEISLIYLLLGS